MSKRLFIGATICVGLLAATACSATAAVSTIFSDDFENYGVGQYPSGAWSTYLGGISAQVTDEQHYAGGKSFRLSGGAGSSRSDVVSIAFPDAFTYTVAAMVGPGSPGGVCGIRKTWAGLSPINAINFDASLGYIGWEGSFDANHLLEECVPGKWYRATVTITGFLGQNARADITIEYDGLRITKTDQPAFNVTQADGGHFQLHTYSRAPSTMYFDSVRIGPANAPPVAVCKAAELVAGATDCCASATPADVDGGSYDPDGPDDIASLCITAVDGNPVACVETASVCGAGQHAVTLTITDNAGLSDTCEAVVTVRDETPPTITCPPDKTLEAPADTDPSKTGEPIADDACGPVTVTYHDEETP
ncbi:MAG TPA: hypothetical protein VM223_09510, partial [Planctomycetota bacterium]|nr:hypothetical protein [Planctomycetota bacterium]